MVSKFFIQTVEIPCKTLWKKPRKTRVKKCSKKLSTSESCVKHLFSTNFSILSHQLINTFSTSIVQLFYPLFHNTYYNNYLFLNNRKERKIL